MDFTTAANDNAVLRSVDATDATLKDGEVPSVCRTEAGKSTDSCPLQFAASELNLGKWTIEVQTKKRHAAMLLGHWNIEMVAG